MTASGNPSANVNSTDSAAKVTGQMKICNIGLHPIRIKEKAGAVIGGQHRPGNVADFMGSPPTNLIAAEVTDSGLLLDGITVPTGTEWHGSTFPKQVIAGIRPEHFSLPTAPGHPD